MMAATGGPCFWTKPVFRLVMKVSPVSGQFAQRCVGQPFAYVAELDAASVE